MKPELNFPEVQASILISGLYQPSIFKREGKGLQDQLQ